MNLKFAVLASVIGAALCGGAVNAQSLLPEDHNHVPAQMSTDPYTEVYITTTDRIYRTALKGVSGLQKVERAASLQPLFDHGSGSEMVIVKTRMGQLSAISRAIHESEKKCGGFTLNDSVAAAEEQILSSRAKEGMTVQALAYTIDQQAFTTPAMSRVKKATVYEMIRHLSKDYKNRHMSTTTGKAAALSIRDKWFALANGRADVTAELFTNCARCGTQPSVILTVKGTELPNEIVVVGGHLDSISNSGTGENMAAPGADDDASGIASIHGAIEALMASGWKPKRTVMFMGYAAEETGLNGSTAIAQSFKSAGKNVVGVLQLDMTNYKASGAPHMSVMTDNTNASLNTFMGNLYDTYLKAELGARSTTSCGYPCSDHASWTQNGFPAAMMSEKPFFSRLHTTGDTLENLGNDAAIATGFAKLAVAFVAEVAKVSSGGGDTNKPPVSNFSYTYGSGRSVSFKDASSDPDGSIVKREWSFGDGGTSTEASPSYTYKADGAFTVSLTVTDDKGATHSSKQDVKIDCGTSCGGGNVLENGKPVTGVSGSQGSDQVWTMSVPANAGNLRFTIAGGTGDADLYVRRDSAPTDTAYDCRPYLHGNDETCGIPNAAAGTYHVRLKGYKSFSGVTLTGAWGVSGGGQTYSNMNDYGVNETTIAESPIAVSGRSGNGLPATNVGVNITHTYIGDLKVELLAPSGRAYMLHNRSGGSADNIQKVYTVDLSSEPLNGNWKLRVTDAARGDNGVLNDWNITF